MVVIVVATAEVVINMIEGLDHIQLALPAGAETAMKAFYCEFLGMPEIAKPVALHGRGGFWAMAGSMQVHFGIDPAFTPATKAHPAFIVRDLDGLAHQLSQADHPVAWDISLPDTRRFFVADPVGNRVELMAARAPV